MKKIALITGAGSGMGRQMVYTLMENIPCIDEYWLIGRRRDRLEETAAKALFPCRIFSSDLTDKSFRLQLIDALRAQDIRITFLVNAAGYGLYGDFRSQEASLLSGMNILNVQTLTDVTKELLPYMDTHSRIINFASSAAFMPQPGFAVYAASKSYVLSFSRALNAELQGSGCYVTAVCPGPVNTEFFSIAEKDKPMPGYKALFMADPRAVCKLALIDSVLKKDVSVYGLPMQLFRFLTRLLPHKLILYFFQKGFRT